MPTPQDFYFQVICKLNVQQLTLNSLSLSLASSIKNYIHEQASSDFEILPTYVANVPILSFSRSIDAKQRFQTAPLDWIDA